MKQNDPSHTLLADAQELGHEARAGHEDHAALKLWLRMLASTTHIEAEIRRRLRERFDISLARDGLVIRESSPSDRRAWIVRLTAKGRRQFETMAQEHEGWILELFAGLDAKTVQQLYQQLGQLRVHLVRHEQGSEES